jgi:hypothetical protein
LLLILGDAVERARWAEVLAARFTVHAAADLAGARGLETAPLLVLVDLAAIGADGEPLAAVVRALYRHSELIGVGAQPSLEALVAGINEANMRRFLPLDTSADEILARLDEVWRGTGSQVVLRRRLELVNEEHATLMTTHNRLIEELTVRESQLAAYTSSQETLRERLQTLVEPIGQTNALTIEALRVRVSEEITKFRRHGLPLCLLVVELTFDVEGGGLRERVRGIAADLVRHIDLVAVDGAGRLVVLMPVTSREQAEVVRGRIVGAASAWSLPVRAGKGELLAYPEDAERLAAFVR